MGIQNLGGMPKGKHTDYWGPVTIQTEETLWHRTNAALYPTRLQEEQTSSPK